MRAPGAKSSPAIDLERRRADPVDRDRAPIDLYPRVGDDRWSDLSLARATWAFVALGVTIRLVRLLLVHPLWGDECFVAANLIDRGYLGLLRPLDYQQVVPILFLWVELAATRLLGWSEWSLRLFPSACAIASLFVFRHLANRLMRGLPLLMAVAFVAVAVNPIRHGGEAKPYATDFLVSCLLLAILVEWWRSPGRPTWLWTLAAFTPVAMGLSLPSSFVLGGFSLAILGRVWKTRDLRVTLAYLALNAAILASFAVVLTIHGGDKTSETKQYMDHYWSGLFPPLVEPVHLIPWLINAHTGHLFAYPAGGANGASLVTVALVLTGLVDLARRGRGMIALACVAPLAPALVASFARIYPYGESERLMQFEGPMICLLGGYGLARAIGLLGQPGVYRLAVLASLVALGGLGLGLMVADIIQPGKSVADLRAREFYRWFWAEAEQDAELACARVDLGLDFEGGPIHYGRSADYLTYEKIDSTRHRRGLPLDWARVSAGHPLRVVIYDGVPGESPLFRAWMGRMSRHYRLNRVETYRANSGHSPRGVSSEDHLAVLEFQPIGSPVDPSLLANAAILEADKASRGSLTVSGPR